MKCLIVDDESHVREAIQLLLPWDALGFDLLLTAQSVPQALRLVMEERPELAIVDVVIGDALGMEIMNGINDSKCGTKVIVISGHDDFQYVRAMFILGAMEYLLKPIEQDKLLGAVKKAVAQLQENSGQEEFAVDQGFKALSPDHRHGLLRKLFRPELAERVYEELLRGWPRGKDCHWCRILHCTGSTLPVHQEGYMLKLSRLVNRIQEKLETEEKGTVFQNMQPSMDIVILIYGEERMDFDREIQGLRLLAMRESCVLSLGGSRTHRFPEELNVAWKEARIAADYLTRTGVFSVKSYQEGMTAMVLRENFQIESALHSAVLLGDVSSVEEQIALWRNDMKRQLPDSIGLLRNLWESFFSMFRRWERAAEISEEDIFFGRTAKTFGDLLAGSWEDAGDRMEQYFCEITKTFMENRRQLQHASGMMPKVAEFLELNYMKKVSQQECADYFHINKDYLSRAFKKDTGIGMTKYLNQIRIRKARELLRTTDLQVQEIADRVGYFDAKYFSRQFKLETGMTPAQYRQRSK